MAISCKKTGMKAYVGSWYVKSERIEFLTLDSVSDKTYTNSYLFRFEKEGNYYSMKVNDTISTGSWAMIDGNDDLFMLDGNRYNITDKTKHGFSLKKADIGIDSMMISYTLERNH